MTWKLLLLGALSASAAAVACETDALGSGASQVEAEVELAGHLQKGPHRVGFRTETLRFSDTETAVGGLPSAVDLYLWYPAVDPERGGTDTFSSMVFGDYYRAQEETESSDEVLREQLLEDMTSPSGVETATLASVIEAQMWATRDADRGEGIHPLVLWSYRDSVPTMQALLNEYLASHGYVVAFAWPRDRVPLFPWQEGLSPMEKHSALDAQVGMLERVLDGLSRRAWIDGSRISVLAWSYGGESAGALQRRRSDVDLVIGIDATIVSGWVYRPSEESAALERSELSVPYVLIRNGRPRIDGQPSSVPSLLTEIPAGSWFVRFPALSHGNFNFPGGMIPGILNLEDVSSWAVGGVRARRGYEVICRHVLGFLDIYNHGAPEELSSWSPDAPAGFVEVERFPPH